MIIRKPPAGIAADVLMSLNFVDSLMILLENSGREIMPVAHDRAEQSGIIAGDFSAADD
ncbi:MAG TPA: hypothetical protein VM487_07855 [Phycisphaerae bacterium]|nr:hypothetical protein [Phycisphaerae bacterium]